MVRFGMKSWLWLALRLWFSVRFSVQDGFGFMDQGE